MGIGRVLKTAAPIAAGYFLPGSATLFGSQLGAQIAAGAATGAGIAALSGEDVLGGAVTGGLGGMTGGSLQSAFGPGAVAQAPTVPTSQLNANALKAATDTTGKNLLQGAQNVGIPGDLGSINTSNIIGQGVPSSGFGINLGNQTAGTLGSSVGNEFLNVGAPGITSTQGIDLSPLATQSTSPVGTDFMSGVNRLGDGSTAMGMGRLGLMGLGVAGGAGAFDPEPVDIGPREEERYDPTRRLNLGMDTGIGGSLRRDTGLRLLAQGGEVKKFVLGGKTESEYTPEQLTKLEAYGVVPQYKAPQMYGMGAFANSDKYKTAQYRNPVTGIVDVGGKFVATPKGDITDVDYVKNYKYILEDTTAEKNQQGGMDPNLAPGGQGGQDGSLNPGAISALASGFAQQQMNPPTKSQTLGLEALAGGGYLETGGEVGDGMSDEIEATIEGEQEARLSDGEFVIPADVVSHLGNGSSDAGAKRLYEMMDKIRIARTGTKKQGKEINPERYMPA
jgi:hypothetical protein